MTTPNTVPKNMDLLEISANRAESGGLRRFDFL
jgi:hypothetical protein